MAYMTELETKIAEKRASRVASAPESARKLLGRCHAGKVAPRSAIKGFCLECLGFDRAGIAECTDWACPLWHFRPFQHMVEQNDDERSAESI